jgi:hypothetical protein
VNDKWDKAERREVLAELRRVRELNDSLTTYNADILRRWRLVAGEALGVEVELKGRFKQGQPGGESWEVYRDRLASRLWEGVRASRIDKPLPDPVLESLTEYRERAEKAEAELQGLHKLMDALRGS